MTTENKQLSPEKKERKSRECLERNKIETLKFSRGGKSYKFILDTRNTENSPGIKLWGIIDFLVRIRGYILLSNKMFAQQKRRMMLSKEIQNT